MSYEDIVQAQAKRDAKEATAVKRKRGVKRKGTVTVPKEVKRVRKSELEAAEEEIKAMGLEVHCSVLQF